MFFKKNNFLFVRIPKTASTTLVKALNNADFTERGSKLSIKVSNVKKESGVGLRRVDEKGRKVPRKLVESPPKNKYMSFFAEETHTMMHANYKQWVEFDSAAGEGYRFSFVRNPWDWMVSQYVFMMKLFLTRSRAHRRGRPSSKARILGKAPKVRTGDVMFDGTRPYGPLNDFGEQLKKFEISVADFAKYPAELTFKRYVDVYFSKDEFEKTQSSFLKNSNGEMAMDFIGKFESLQSDWDIVANKLNIPERSLGKTNASKGRFPYEDYYSSEEVKKIVSEGLAEDIENFGYEFGA